MRKQGAAVLSGPVRNVVVARWIVRYQRQILPAAGFLFISLGDVQMVVQGMTGRLILPGKGRIPIRAQTDLACRANGDRCDHLAGSGRDRTDLADVVSGQTGPGFSGLVEGDLAAVGHRVGVPDAEVEEYVFPAELH